ncbi:MAG: MipA/OmpV family protein [Woeseiaceae bacterium]|nr:MipA/OmpV family protein [Woeseiaceae bacterium]
MVNRITYVALLLSLFAAAPSVAAPGSENQKESNWRLGAAFGYGQRSNPLVQSDDIPIFVDLDVAWFGERWFFDNGDLGFTFANNDVLTMSAIARVNSDRLFFSRTDTRFVNFDLAGAPLAEVANFKPPDRDYAVELGVELLTDGRWGAMQITAFHDISGTHEGYELYFDYSYSWRRQRLVIRPSFGVSYKSADLNNYYWGITAEEAGTVANPYDAEAGLNWHARMMLGYQLNEHWAISLVAEHERLNDEAAASPIVEDEKLLGWFAGVSWRF